MYSPLSPGFLWCRTAIVLLIGASLVSAAIRPPDAVELRDLTGFRSDGDNWRIAGAIAGDPRVEKVLRPVEGTGLLLNAPADGVQGRNLFTTWEHGDLELEVEYLVPAGSNSGLYLQGRYEIQIFDSWAIDRPRASDAGGIYERWDESRPTGQRGFEGHAPAQAVSRAPGLWQQLRIVFRAPRFDDTGRKVRPARFERVEHNGVVIHEGVDVHGPTRSAAFADERPTGPLMIQGDHGPVAFRNLRYRHLGGAAPSVHAVRYQVYEGSFSSRDALSGRSPQREGTTTEIRAGLAGISAPHALVVEGELHVPVSGAQVMALTANGIASLSVAGRTVIEAHGGERPVTVELPAGRHPFELVYLRTTARGQPALSWIVAAPAADEVSLTVAPSRSSASDRPALRIESEGGRPRLQRTFFAFEGGKRVYAMVVGSDRGRHFAYDLAQGTLLAVWRGGFADVTDLWRDRGIEQTARPTGSVLALDGRPAVASLGMASAPWPPGDTALLKPRGYTLDQDGVPTFRYDISSAQVTDRIVPRADGQGLDRIVTIQGDPIGGTAYLLLAEDASIVSRPGGYIIGDRRWYLDVGQNDSTLRPLIRTDRGRRQLIVPLGTTTGERSFRYSLIW